MPVVCLTYDAVCRCTNTVEGVGEGWGRGAHLGHARVVGVAPLHGDEVAAHGDAIGLAALLQQHIPDAVGDLQIAHAALRGEAQQLAANVGVDEALLVAGQVCILVCTAWVCLLTALMWMRFHAGSAIFILEVACAVHGFTAAILSPSQEGQLLRSSGTEGAASITPGPFHRQPVLLQQSRKRVDKPFVKRSMRSIATSMQPSKPMHSICRAACR